MAFNWYFMFKKEKKKAICFVFRYVVINSTHAPTDYFMADKKQYQQETRQLNLGSRI